MRRADAAACWPGRGVVTSSIFIVGIGGHISTSLPCQDGRFVVVAPYLDLGAVVLRLRRLCNVQEIIHEAGEACQ